MTVPKTRSLITARDPKGLHATKLFEDAYNKAKLDDDRAQRLNENGGELQEGILKLIAQFSTPNQYANEVVKSNYTYPQEYKGPKAIEEQIMALAAILDLDPSNALEHAKSLPDLPDGAEGWFVRPSVDAIAAKHFPEIKDKDERYCRAVQFLFEKLGAARPFYNCREGQITPKHLRLHIRTAQALAQHAEVQKGDIQIIAAQLGLKHRGESVRRARETFVADEFGIDIVAATSVALVHPERFVRWEELDMDLPGNEWSLDGDGEFAYSAFLDFCVGRLLFVSGLLGFASGHYGSASGFHPVLPS